MTGIETKNIEIGQEKIDEELKKLKTEMIERIIEKLKENNNDDFLDSKKDKIIDYLLDEGKVSDKIKDFFIGIYIKLFSKSAKDLKNLREEIKKIDTKESLGNFEKSISENLNNIGDNQQNTVGVVKPEITGQNNQGSQSASSNASESKIELSVDSAKVGEAVNVPKQKRMKRLFPEGTPKSEEQMKKYLTKITVPIRTADGQQKSKTLYVHKKLSNEYMAIFKEMYEKKIPVNPRTTGAYNRRLVRGSSRSLSHHSYGSAIDVNWNVNGGVYGSTVKNSPYYNNQDTVAIRKKHGFYWGGDWSSRKNDPMHFTYMGG